MSGLDICGMSLLDASANACADYPGGVEVVAGRMGKSPSTLYKELQGAGTAKLGALDAVKIAQITQDVRIPLAFAQACGGLYTPLLPVAPNLADALQAVAHMSKEFGDVLTAVTMALADGRVTQNELREIQAQWLELVAAGAGTIAACAAAYEAGVPAFARGA
jgi:hypothetical protein